MMLNTLTHPKTYMLFGLSKVTEIQKWFLQLSSELKSKISHSQYRFT